MKLRHLTLLALLIATPASGQQLFWDQPSMSPSEAQVATYHILLNGAQAASPLIQVCSATDVTTCSAALPGAQAPGTYQLGLRVTTPTGTALSSTIPWVVGNQQPPPEPVKPTTPVLTATVTGPNSVRLSWIDVSNGAGGVASYNLRQSPPPHAWGLGPGSPVIDLGLVAGLSVGQTRTFDVTTLASNTVYDFQMVAYRANPAGSAQQFSDLSNVVQIKTPAVTTPPVPPVDPITKASITNRRCDITLVVEVPLSYNGVGRLQVQQLVGSTWTNVSSPIQRAPYSLTRDNINHGTKFRGSWSKTGANGQLSQEATVNCP